MSRGFDPGGCSGGGLSGFGEGVGAPLLVEALDVVHDLGEPGREQSTGHSGGDGGPEVAEDGPERGDDAFH